MKVVIIEDEPIGARRLKRLLLQVSPNTEVVATLESVMEAKAWMENIELGNIDLFFSDIQLADGLAFDIFEGSPVPVPIIFTTAYDEYALRAFRYNGIAYLLKPVQESEPQTEETDAQGESMSEAGNMGIDKNSINLEDAFANAMG